MQLAMADLTTNLTAGTTVLYRPAPRAFTLSAVRAYVLSQSFSGQIIVNVKLNGTSIFGTRITIDQDEHSSTTSSAPPVLVTTAIPDDGLLTVDIDAPGIGARGLVVTLIGS